MPTVTVIPAPIAYIQAAVVKMLVVWILKMCFLELEFQLVLVQSTVSKEPYLRQAFVYVNPTHVPYLWMNSPTLTRIFRFSFDISVYSYNPFSEYSQVQSRDQKNPSVTVESQ